MQLKDEDLRAYHAFAPPPRFYMKYFSHIHTLSSGVRVVRVIVMLALRHWPHIIVLISVILYGVGGGGGVRAALVALRCDAMLTDRTTSDGFLDVYKSLGSELDFKVAWFDLLMINDSIGLWGLCLVLLYLIVCIVQSDALREKIQRLVNCCELKETLLLLLLGIILFIYFLCTSWNGLNFALLASIVYWHKVHPFDLQRLRCSLWCL